jgi:hypothetical protein
VKFCVAVGAHDDTFSYFSFDAFPTPTPAYCLGNGHFFSLFVVMMKVQASRMVLSAGAADGALNCAHPADKFAASSACRFYPFLTVSGVPLSSVTTEFFSILFSPRVSWHAIEN